MSVFDVDLSSFDKEPGDLSPACTNIILLGEDEFPSDSSHGW
jgi:hypothetical protein